MIIRLAGEGSWHKGRQSRGKDDSVARRSINGIAKKKFHLASQTQKGSRQVGWIAEEGSKADTKQGEERGSDVDVELCRWIRPQSSRASDLRCTFKRFDQMLCHLAKEMGGAAGVMTASTSKESKSWSSLWITMSSLQLSDLTSSCCSRWIIPAKVLLVDMDTWCLLWNSGIVRFKAGFHRLAQSRASSNCSAQQADLWCATSSWDTGNKEVKRGLCFFVLPWPMSKNNTIHHIYLYLVGDPVPMHYHRNDLQ